MCAVRTFGWGGLEKKKELARKVSGSEKWKIHASIAGGGAFISSNILHVCAEADQDWGEILPWLAHQL